MQVSEAAATCMLAARPALCSPGQQVKHKQARYSCCPIDLHLTREEATRRHYGEEDLKMKMCSYLGVFSVSFGPMKVSLCIIIEKYLVVYFIKKSWR